MVRRLVLEKLPLFALSAASCIITVIAQRRALEPTLSMSLLQRIGNAAVSYVTYLAQTIYPLHLTVSYPYTPIRLGEAIPAALFLAVATAVCFVVRKKFPFLITGWLWYLGVLVPMIGLIQVGLQPRADRYTYFVAHRFVYLGCVRRRCFGKELRCSRARAFRRGRWKCSGTDPNHSAANCVLA